MADAKVTPFLSPPRSFSYMAILFKNTSRRVTFDSRWLWQLFDKEQWRNRLVGSCANSRHYRLLLKELQTIYKEGADRSIGKEAASCADRCW